MDQKPNNSKEKDNLKESGEHFDASNGKDMKNIEEEMQKLEIEGTENEKMEGQIESENCNETKKEDFYVPNWLIEASEWIERMEMANSLLSSSSRLFERICWPKLHGKVEPHRVPFLFISSEENDKLHHSRPIIKGKSKTENGFEDLPIPLVAPPGYIIGFDWITICFLDEQLLQFFKCIAPILKNCTFEFNNWTMDDTSKRAQICELILLLADKMSMFCLDDLYKFDQFFPELINQTQCIAIPYCKYGFEPLFKWLTEKRNDGKQKILRLKCYRPAGFGNGFGIFSHLDRIKEEFSNSTLRSNYLIWQERFYGDFFTMENKKTDEILELYENKRGHRYLARYPKGEEYWKEEGEGKAWPCDEDSTLIVVDNRKNKNVFHWMITSSIYSEFELFKEGLQKILCKRRPIYSLCNMKNIFYDNSHCQRLYNEMKKIIKEHLQTSIRTMIMESIGSDNFVGIFNAVWNDHIRAMDNICFWHLNRQYVSKTGLLGINEFGMEIFGKEIVKHPPINEYLKATFGEDLAMAMGVIDDSLIEFMSTRING